MATMLSYILTDLDVPKSVLEACLQRVVRKTFNTISVDGDQSTSDTVLVMSSQIMGYKPSDEAEFERALQEVCSGLAEDIVRNGKHFILFAEILLILRFFTSFSFYLLIIISLVKKTVVFPIASFLFYSCVYDLTCW